MKTRRWVYLATFAVLGVALSAKAWTTAANHPTAVTAQDGSGGGAENSSTPRHDSDAILPDGVKANWRIAVERVLLDPESNARVVPLVAELELSYGGQEFNRSMAFEIRPADGTSSVGWTLSPVGPAVVDDSLVGVVPNRRYEFKITPRTGVTWKDVRSIADASLSAVELQ